MDVGTTIRQTKSFLLARPDFLSTGVTGPRIYSGLLMWDRRVLGISLPDSNVVGGARTVAVSCKLFAPELRLLGTTASHSRRMVRERATTFARLRSFPLRRDDCDSRIATFAPKRDTRYKTGKRVPKMVRVG
eukprot:5418460-Amphidinium_carterae.1